MNKAIMFMLVLVFSLYFTTGLIDLGNEFKKNECIELAQTCDNCTWVNLSSVTYPNSTIYYINSGMTKVATRYNYTFCSTSALGDYKFSVLGDKDGINSTEEGMFSVTYMGDSLDTSKSLMYLGLLGILIFFFVLIIWFTGKLPDSETRSEEGELISISNLKYVGSILLFVDWMILVAIFYITSNLAFAYLGEVMFAKILFTLFRVCFGLTLPIVIVWFIWIFYQIFKDKKLKRMMEKGLYEGYNL